MPVGFGDGDRPVLACHGRVFRLPLVLIASLAAQAIATGTKTTRSTQTRDDELEWFQEENHRGSRSGSIARSRGPLLRLCWPRFCCLLVSLHSAHYRRLIARSFQGDIPCNTHPTRTHIYYASCLPNTTNERAQTRVDEVRRDPSGPLRGRRRPCQLSRVRTPSGRISSANVRLESEGEHRPMSVLGSQLRCCYNL